MMDVAAAASSPQFARIVTPEADARLDGDGRVVARAALPFSKGPFEAAGVRGEMLTVMDGALRQLLRLTEENRELRGRAAEVR